MSKFKVGDRVRLKEGYMGFDSGYEFVVERVGSSYAKSDGGMIYANETGGVFGKRLELVTKGGEQMQPYQRKTYRQLKDMATTRKGAVWQEACDDGTQEYILISTEDELDKKHGQSRGIWDRALIEDNPKWFVEVFKVQPEYQTREELEKWKAFNKKPAAKKKSVRKK